MILGTVELDGVMPKTLFSVDQTRIIEQVTFVNRNPGVGVGIRMWVVPRDVERTDTHAWLYDMSLPAQSTIPILEKDLTMRYGEKIVVESDTANVNAIVVGR
jgi:hypothetical protein